MKEKEEKASSPRDDSDNQEHAESVEEVEDADLFVEATAIDAEESFLEDRSQGCIEERGEPVVLNNSGEDPDKLLKEKEISDTSLFGAIPPEVADILHDPETNRWLSETSKSKKFQPGLPPSEVADILHDPETNRWLSETSKSKKPQSGLPHSSNDPDYDAAYALAYSDPTLTRENARAKMLHDYLKDASSASHNPDDGAPGTASEATPVGPTLEHRVTSATAPSTQTSFASDGDRSTIRSNSVATASTANPDRIVPRQVQPGAVAIHLGLPPPPPPQVTTNDHPQPPEEAATRNGHDSNQSYGSPVNNPHDEVAPTEPLVSATLVGDEPDPHSSEFVEAEPALEGLAAIVHNRYFKYMVAASFLVLLAIAIPLGIILPGDGDILVTTSTEEDVLNCGTRSVQQGDYRGFQTVSELGIECQEWGVQFPHQHDYTPENFPNGDLRKNYCRNPCGDCEPRAWCYTTDPLVRWAYCDVDFCGEPEYEFKEECGTAALGGYDYRGNISRSSTGKKCLPWTHPMSYNTPENRPNAGLEANYCRNPDSTYPYCLVNDPVSPKEFCDVPQCGNQGILENSAYTSTCKNCSKKECGTPRLRYHDYRGTINVTISGLPCKRWDDRLTFNTGNVDNNEVKVYDTVENYCRNPDYDTNPEVRFAWCWVDSPGMDKEFEYCDIQPCEENNLQPRRFCGSKDIAQQDYRGDVRTTITGKQCVWWIIGDAILERNTPWDLPFDGLVDAYCRNPDGKRAGAWCYVNALPGEKNWEFCDIPFCKDCGSESQNKQDYTGTQAQTRSGKTCIPWEDMEPFLVEENSTLSIRIDFSGFDLLYQAGIRREHNLDENYCRNPLPYQRETVFCFVDESGAWEYCDVPTCEEDGNSTITRLDCGSPAIQQQDYRGELNVTASGRSCAPWGLQNIYTNELYPDSGLDGNYCRQPKGTLRLAAWCFVNLTDMTWEYCDVPACD